MLAGIQNCSAGVFVGPKSHPAQLEHNVSKLFQVALLPHSCQHGIEGMLTQLDASRLGLVEDVQGCLAVVAVQEDCNHTGENILQKQSHERH